VKHAEAGPEKIARNPRRESALRMKWGLGRLLVAAAVVIFLLSAFGVEVGGDVGLVALGLAFFAAGQLL